MARTLEVPAIVGAGYICDEVFTGMDIIIDAIEGIVILHPNEKELEIYSKKRDEFLGFQNKDIF